MARKYIFDEKDSIYISQQIIKYYGKEMNHIKVMRHKIGENIIINNCLFNIIEIDNDSITVKKIKESEQIEGNNITLFQSYLKGDKMDLVVQKMTEFGLKSVIPFLSTNTVVKLDEKDKCKKIDKLNLVAKEATKQCGRTDELDVSNVVSTNEMLNMLASYDLVIFAYEKGDYPLVQSIENQKKKKRKFSSIAIIVGPEGGFTESEENEISKLENVETVTLGKIVLRAETASFYLASIISYEFFK